MRIENMHDSFHQPQRPSNSIVRSRGFLFLFFFVFPRVYAGDAVVGRTASGPIGSNNPHSANARRVSSGNGLSFEAKLKDGNPVMVDYTFKNIGKDTICLVAPKMWGNQGVTQPCFLSITATMECGIKKIMPPPINFLWISLASLAPGESLRTRLN